MKFPTCFLNIQNILRQILLIPIHRGAKDIPNLYLNREILYLLE